MSNYKKTVGIEVHCELKTKTKMFSNTLNNYGAKENSQVNTIDLAYPGSLPLVNKGAINFFRAYGCRNGKRASREPF